MASYSRVNGIRHVVFTFLIVVMAASPVYEAFGEMQATPIVDPPTEVPSSPEPTEAPVEPIVTPSPSIPAGTPPVGPATPSADDSNRARMQPANLLNENTSGSMRNCSQSSLGVPPGGSVSIVCDLVVGVVLLGSPIAQITRPELLDDFTASITMVHGNSSVSMPTGSSESVLRMSLGLTAVGGTRTARVTILIDAPTNASPNDAFTARFDTCRGAATGGCLNQPGWVDIGLTVDEISLVDGTHYEAGCSIPDPSAVGFEGRVVSTCSVTAGEIGSGQLVLNDLVTTLNGSSGWSGRLVSIEGEEPVPTGFIPGLYRIDPAPTLSQGETFSWQIWLEPTACSAGDRTLDLGIRGNITLVNSEGESLGPTITTAPRTITVDFIPPAKPFAGANVTVSPEFVDVPYSMISDHLGSLEVTLQYTVEGCEPWDGYIQMSPFSSPDGTYSVPVPELPSASHGDTSFDGPGFTHLSFTEFTTIDATPTHVIAGTEPGMRVTVDHTLNIQYTIPANTPVGTYTSTITVTTSAGPD